MARDYAVDRMSSRPSAPLRQQQPGPPPPPRSRARGRNRGQPRPPNPPRQRGRNRGNGGDSGTTTTGSSRVTIRCRDTEILTDVTAATTGPKALVFNPAPDNLVRLQAESTKYLKYRINSMVIRYRPHCASTTAGAINFGVQVGPELDGIKVAALRPAVLTAVWRPGVLRVGADVMMQQHLFSGDKDGNSVAFCLYVELPSGKKLSDYGNMEVTYDVTFSFPRP